MASEQLGAGSIIGYLAGIAAVGKTAYDIYNSKRTSDTAAATGEANSQNTAFTAMGQAVTASANTSTQWMDKVSQLLKDVGALNERINGQERKITHLEGVIEDLNKRIDGKEQELQAALLAIKEKDATIATRDRRIVVLEKQAAYWEESTRTYMDGFSSQSFLNAVAAGEEKGDSGMIAMAQATIKKTIDYDTERRKRDHKPIDYDGKERRQRT